MEVILPIAALGGLFTISMGQRDGFNNRTSTSSSSKAVPPAALQKPHPQQSQQTPSVVAPGPIPANSDAQSVRRFASANRATSDYLNQNIYEQQQVAGVKVGNVIQNRMNVTGNYADPTFTHNNMVPFTRGTPYGQIYKNDHAATILDTYTGAGSQDRKKIEQAPLFKPQDSIQWAHGMPSTSDFVQSRMVPPTNNSMVKPFETQQMGGTNGLNSDLEERHKWLPKTVDELRVATNPKETYSLAGHQGPAANAIKDRGTIGTVERYRPDGFYVNSQDRWLTTTGAEHGPRQVAEELDAASRRGTADTYQPGIAGTTKTAAIAPQNYIMPEECALPTPPMGHAVASTTAPHFSDKTRFQNSHTNVVTQRATTQQPRTFGTAFSGAVGAIVAPVLDILKPTRKEETACNMRLYGNLGAPVPADEVRNEGDVPDHTLREDTMYSSNGYIGNQGDLIGAYSVVPQQTVFTQRTTTGECTQMGAAGAAYGDRLEDAERRARVCDVRESVMGGRTNAGNISTLNHHMNMRTVEKDKDLQVTRASAPYSATVPSVMQVNGYSGGSGRPQEERNRNEQRQNDRMHPEILDAVRSNPYAFPYNSVA
jgi:hypothetical protein